jgi:transcriptional regulator with XRE-family HTH domain
LATRTVPLRITVVNTVLPVESRGARLRQFLFERTGGQHGWVNALAAKSGVKRQTLSAWMGDRAEPDLESLRAVAEAIDVRLFELVAAMDGEGPVVRFDDALRAMIREEIERYGDQEPPRGSRE